MIIVLRIDVLSYLFDVYITIFISKTSELMIMSIYYAPISV